MITGPLHDDLRLREAADVDAAVDTGLADADGDTDVDVAAAWLDMPAAARTAAIRIFFMVFPLSMGHLH